MCAPGGERLLGVDEDREWLVVDVDQVAGVLGLIARVRHDGDDRLPDMANRLFRQQVSRARHQLGAALEARHVRLCVRREVGPREDAEHTRRGPRPQDVNRADTRVRECAAQERAVHHPAQLDVVEELTLAAQEAGVLVAQDPRPDEAALVG